MDIHDKTKCQCGKTLEPRVVFNNQAKPYIGYICIKCGIKIFKKPIKSAVAGVEELSWSEKTINEQLREHAKSDQIDKIIC